MTYEQIATMVAEMGYPNAYYQFERARAKEPPFICFYYPEIDDVYADDSNYQRIVGLTVELYTRKKDFAAEDAVENILQTHGIPYDKNEEYIEDEQLYEVIYEMEVLINADYSGE